MGNWYLPASVLVTGVGVEKLVPLAGVLIWVIFLWGIALLFSISDRNRG
jgi:hypothetical protein